jgi:pimeloyl-ACP methyl ester carboxylesterase
MTSFLHAGGHRLEYRWAGPERVDTSRPTLVFLHEGLGSIALWKHFPDRVAEATGCRALIYSRYGYGRSERLAAPHGPDYMHREALEVLPEVLSQLGISQPVLIGHSDGASISLIHAGAGHLVEALVLLAPHVFVEEITVRSIAQAKETFLQTNLPERLGRYHDDVQATFWGWNDIWLHPAFRDWNIESFLPRIACPVLLIQGQDDQYGTLDQIEAIRRQVQSAAETVVLPKCGHSPHVDQPEATLAAIAGFVARHGHRNLNAEAQRTQSSQSSQRND